jgi:carboxyl-terminal processing protease
MGRQIKQAFRVALLTMVAGATSSSLVLADSLPRVSDSKGPRAEDRLITRTVSKLMQLRHVSKRKLDDEISRRTFAQFLKALDPYKLYFNKADYDEFARHITTLDDEINRADISFAYTVYQRLLERVHERMPMVHEIIDAPIDFNVSEEIAIEPDIVDYAATPEEMRDRWRKRIKYEYLTLKADKKTDEEIREKLHRRYRSVESYRSQEDVYELLELFLTCYTSSYDPHTSYMAPRAKDNFGIMMGLQLEGIGATLSPEDGVVTIQGLVPGGAADKDGRLKKGDQIVAVGQENSSEEVDVVNMKLDDVVSLIRGPAGTKVRLTVNPKAGGDSTNIEITRARIQLEDSAASSTIIEHAPSSLDPNAKKLRVGYIKLPSFYLDMDAARNGERNYRSTTSDVEAILLDFQTKNIDVVVLDLAKNGGGSLTEAIDCTGLFIDKGPVVQVKDSDGTVVPYSDDNKPGVKWAGPLVVKTDKMSASASEIFAGAIKDYNRGIIVGDPQTHGKGTVQSLEDVNQGMFGFGAKEPLGALKVTTQQFYLPNGRSTQREGVSADVVLPSVLANADISEADLDYALPVDHVQPQPHMDYHLTNPEIRVKLQERSTERISKSTDFDKLLRRIELFKSQKDQKYYSLKESDFLARRAEFNLEKEEEERMNDAELPKDKVFVDDFYNQEVLNIAADYVELLHKDNLVSNVSPARKANK